MDAIGLIETKGLIAAVESADAMLKAAEVTLIEKTYVGGGLVTVTVTGGVAAVKAAVEAGAAAVRHINGTLLLSQHVIPRPHEELDGMVVGVKPSKAEPKTAVITKTKEAKNPVVKETVVKKEAVPLKVNLDEINKETADRIVNEHGLEKALEVLNKLKVVKLRNLAREYKNFGITGRSVSKADKKMLIEEFMKYYSKN